MSEYSVAFVRFSENGKPYPVNSRFNIDVGDFVIIRLDGKYTPLQKAKVVSVESWKKPAKHSVVCRADDEEAYGRGPQGIQTLAHLETFLMGFLKLRKYPVVFQEGAFDEVQPHPRWNAAYLRSKNYHIPDTGFFSAANIIVLGDEEFMHSAPDNGCGTHMLNGSVVFGKAFLPSPSYGKANLKEYFEKRTPWWQESERNIYAYAALVAEPSAILDRNPFNNDYATIMSITGGYGL